MEKFENPQEEHSSKQWEVPQYLRDKYEYFDLRDAFIKKYDIKNKELPTEE